MNTYMSVSEVTSTVVMFRQFELLMAVPAILISSFNISSFNICVQKALQPMYLYQFWKLECVLT